MRNQYKPIQNGPRLLVAAFLAITLATPTAWDAFIVDDDVSVRVVLDL